MGWPTAKAASRTRGGGFAVNLEDTVRTYRTYAAAYDMLFGPIMHPGRRAAVKLLNDRPRQRVLEVGVGTGLSLDYYRPDATVTGIDISPEMLDKARARTSRLKLKNVELTEMNAEAMDFEDNTFDAVLALYVASTVPDLHAFATEVKRVCVPGGRIILVNHFSSLNRVMHLIERRLAPLASRIGFHADFPMEDFLAVTGFKVREILPSNLFGYWKLVRCVNEKNF